MSGSLRSEPAPVEGPPSGDRGELSGDECRGAAVAGPRSCGWRAQRDGRTSSRAGDAVCERVNQLDLRLAKILSGRRQPHDGERRCLQRVELERGADAGLHGTGPAWQRPTAVPARFVKFSVLFRLRRASGSSQLPPRKTLPWPDSKTTDSLAGSSGFLKGAAAGGISARWPWDRRDRGTAGGRLLRLRAGAGTGRR